MTPGGRGRCVVEGGEELLQAGQFGDQLGIGAPVPGPDGFADSAEPLHRGGVEEFGRRAGALTRPRRHGVATEVKVKSASAQSVGVAATAT